MNYLLVWEDFNDETCTYLVTPGGIGYTTLRELHGTGKTYYLGDDQLPAWVKSRLNTLQKVLLPYMETCTKIHVPAAIVISGVMRSL